MPRSLVFGNGRMLVQIDDRGNIRDLCAPHIGQYNHLNGAKIRLGVWVDGQFSWLDSDEWERKQDYCTGAIGLTFLRLERLQLEVVIDEEMDTEKPLFIRFIRVVNHSDRDREVRLFQTQDLRIAESDIGDTALYAPELGGVVHFKGDHWFAFTGTDLYQWECGYKNWQHFVGTWCDAEDGWLGGKPIEQGSVDSTFSMRAQIIAGGDHFFTLSIAYASSVDLLKSALVRTPPDPTPEPVMFKSFRHEPSDELKTLYFQSIRVIQSQCDRGGAVLAANDSDIMETNRAGYAYCWPRDGAHVASIMRNAGQPEIAERFLGFCDRLITPERPFFFQKYHPDGTWGATWHPWIVDGQPEMPLQEDETALVVSLAAEHGGHDRIIELCAPFLASFVDENGLPKPSYDLWEERRGIHCNTVATVIQALRATGYTREAERMNAAWNEHAWDEENGRYARMLSVGPHGYARDMTLDSAMLAYATLYPGEERWQKTVNQLDHGLRVLSPIGGYARYEHDYYHRKSDAYPGNPWIITTLWFGLYDLACGRRETLEQAVNWVQDRASTTGMLAEQYHPETGEALSVSPLTWSHAEFVGAVLALEG